MESKMSETLKALFGTLGFLFVLLPIFLIGMPFTILSAPNHVYLFDIGVFRYFGMVPIGVGVIIYFWCSYNFVVFGKGTPIPFTPTKKLVVTGLYRFVRNPIYIAGSFVLAGEGLLFQSKGIFLYFIVMFGIFNIHVLMEETLLAEKFGVTYEHYRKSVPRWIPRLTPYRENDSGPQ